MGLHCSIILAIFGAVFLSNATASNEPLAISSLAELAKAAAQSGQKVKMEPGVYRLVDFIPPTSVPERRERKEWQFLSFSGSDNVFDLRGVTLELDTVLRALLRAPIHTDEFRVSGRNVTIEGLTITSVGNGKALGGAVLGLAGPGATLRDCTIHVQGSAPYGYGDLFGKGGYKHSGVHITGSGARILGCKVFTKAFGHGFYLQEDCNDVLFEDCHVEGVMRRTDEILAETSGLAFDRKFRTELVNRSGAARILPGYMKALSEDAFRTYGTHRGVVLRHCTAKHMRGGFELRTQSAPSIEYCTAVGCERAFWVSTGAVVTECSGDAQFGPLLYVEGDRAKVDVRLLPAESGEATVHAIAAIYGTGNDVSIIAATARAHPQPILVGYCPPPAGENMVAHSERPVRDLNLRNSTTMPVVIGAKASQCRVITRGPVEENHGKDIVVTPLAP